MELEFSTPPSLGIKDKKLYLFIIELYHAIKFEKGKTVKINFSKTKWIDPSVCSILALIFDELNEKNGLIFKFVELQNRHLKLFKNNGFLWSLQASNKENYENPSIELKKVSTNNSKNIINYLEKKLESHDFYYKNNKHFRNVSRCILEIFKNCSMHGEAEHIYICGHYFPETKSLIFTLSNFGNTFKENYIKKLGYIFKNNISAISYSYKRASTSRSDEESGGLGFYFITQFLNSLSGQLIIFSGDALFINYVNEKKKIETEIEKYEYDKIFPGTFVSIRFNLNENFFLESENVFTINKLGLTEILKGNK